MMDSQVSIGCGLRVPTARNHARCGCYTRALYSALATMTNLRYALWATARLKAWIQQAAEGRPYLTEGVLAVRQVCGSFSLGNRMFRGITFIDAAC